MLFVFAAFFAHAASFSSVQSGNWNDPATWHAGGTGAIPGATDNATLSTGHSIVVSDNRTVGRLIVNGTSRSLSINTNMTLTVLGTISLASSVDQNWCLGDGFLRFSGDGDRGDGGGVAGSDLGFSGSAASIGSYNTNINLIVDLTNSTDTVRIPQTFVCKSLEIVRGVLKISTIQIMTGSSARNLYFNTTTNGTAGSISIASNGRLMVAVVGRRVNGSSTEVASSFIETLTVNGTLELRSAGSGTSGGFAAKNVTINGTFIVKNTAGSAVVSSPTDAIVWGNNSILEYQSNTSGAFQNFGAEISRNGGSVPTIGSLVINVQGTTEEVRTFSRSLKIRNELKFINGKLNFGAGSEKITLLSTAIISGYGITKYVYFSGTTSSSNKGFIKEGIVNNANFLFPVGTNATNYTPITLTNRSGASLDYEISIVLPALTTNVSNFTAISGYEGHLNGEWNMGKVGGGASNVDILLEYGSLAFTGTFHNDHAQFVHHPNGNGTIAWETPLISTYNGNSVKVSNYTGTFSPFAVGDFGRSMVLLPVELISFEANALENSVALTWITASERNNDYFTLEKSVDGEIWSELSKIEGMGNSTSKNNYGFLDENEGHNQVYYRLKQTDFNGEFKYLKTIIFERELANFEVELFPNPVQNQLTITANSLIEKLLITTNLGQIVYFESNIPAGKTVLNLDFLSTGNYLIQFQTENQDYNKSFVKL